MQAQALRLQNFISLVGPTLPLIFLFKILLDYLPQSPVNVGLSCLTYMSFPGLCAMCTGWHCTATPRSPVLSPIPVPPLPVLYRFLSTSPTQLSHPCGGGELVHTLVAYKILRSSCFIPNNYTNFLLRNIEQLHFRPLFPRDTNFVMFILCSRKKYCQDLQIIIINDKHLHSSYVSAIMPYHKVSHQTLFWRDYHFMDKQTRS